MGSLLRAYRALVRAHWAMVLEYRAQAVIWILSWLFPLVMMAVWLAVVDEVGPAAGWERSDFVSYYVAAAAMMYLTAAWVVWDWDEDIRTGGLSVKLLKPLDPVHHFVSESLGWKIFFVVFFLPVVAVAGWLLPAIRYPLTPGRLAAVGASVVLGFALNMAMSTAFAMLAFWSTQARNVSMLWTGAGQFLSGWIAPLALFPGAVRQIAFLLPFRSTLGLPIEILMGRLDTPGIWFGLAVTAGWTVFFVILYRVLWRLGLKRYESVGA